MSIRFIGVINDTLSKETVKAIFDHLRNFLICAFLFSIGAYAITSQSENILGLFTSRFTGYMMVILASILTGINLFDGVRQLSRIRYHVIIQIALILFYIIFALRIIEITWEFRSLSHL